MRDWVLLKKNMPQHAENFILLSFKFAHLKYSTTCMMIITQVIIWIEKLPDFKPAEFIGRNNSRSV